MIKFQFIWILRIFVFDEIDNKYNEDFDINSKIGYMYLSKDNVDEHKPLCNSCFTEDGLKRCSSCKVARYCCGECQVSDWENHKLYCI